MRALLVTLTIAGLLAGCAPYRLPGESAQDAFLRHENNRRNSAALMQAGQNLAAQPVYMPTRQTNSFTCTRDWGGHSTTCQ